MPPIVYTGAANRSRYLFAGGGSGGGGGGTPPDGVADLYLWWDAFDSASYDGSSFFSGITDKGPNTINGPVPSPGITATPYNVNGVPTNLPGPFPFSGSTQYSQSALGLAKSLVDFTVMLLIPINSTRVTTATYFSLNLSGFPFFGAQMKQGALAAELEVVGSGGAVATAVGFDNAAANGAHAIFFARRSSSGNTLTLDSWYDQLLGGGIVKPPQVVGVDPVVDPIPLDNVTFGGRGSITYTWQGTAPIHMAAVWDRSLSNAEVLSLAQWGGARLGIGPIV